MEEVLQMKKLYNADCITLDGRMDEAVWDEVPTYGDFSHLQGDGGHLQKEKTYFKIIPCHDRIYIGVKCMEPDEMQECIAYGSVHAINDFNAQSVTLFFSPTGGTFEDYQFTVGWFGQRLTKFYSERGTIEPDPYAPDWRAEVYTGEDYWSTEIEIPLTAFYMTPHALWSDTWMLNMCRTRKEHIHSSWCPVKFGFNDMAAFKVMSGFPVLPAEDDVRICTALAELENQTDAGYEGVMTVKTVNAVAGEFEFAADHAAPVRVSLVAGDNEFKLPCVFDATGCHQEGLSLTRLSDGKVFKRYFPVRTSYEPLKVQFSLPEYRNNFYPGQDYSKIVGKVIAKTPATVKLEGPGIETQTYQLGEDGAFSFETPNFEVGEAWLTATIEGHEVKKKIRRLAPNGHTMTWVSGGNIVCDGEVVFPRWMYATYYLGSKPFNDRYDSEEQYNTPKFALRDLMPEYLVPGSGRAGGEITQDGMPSEAMKKAVDAVIEKNKNADFTCYYLCDEPECRGVSPVYLKNLYEYIADKDPYHTVMTASREAETYVDCADWFQAHPYIIPFTDDDGTRSYMRPNHRVGSFIDGVVRMNRPDKCMGFLPTCFAYKIASGNFDFPTFDEYLHNAWGAIIHGAKSLWPYVYRDLNDRAAMYEGTKYLFSTVQALEDILLYGERTQLYYSQLAEVVRYDYKDEKIFVAVNFTQEPQTISVDGIDGQWHAFRRNRMISGNTITLHPFETLIGTSAVRDAGLPTYEEIIAVVEKEEYERTHTGSLLVDRQDDMVITCTGNPRYYVLSPYKLFDGVRNNRGATIAGSTDLFFEMDITKIKPTFSKIVVYGTNLEGMTVQVRNNGELSTPEITEVIAGESSMTFMLKDAITPDCLRFEFVKALELYEIEVF